jgi:hypothetical protein
MKKLLISMALVVVTLSGFAQELKYKALHTLNLVRYIDWPNDQKMGDFVIGVVAKSDLVAALKEQAFGKKFGNQDIVIKEFKNVSEITRCQVIYISRTINFSKNVPAITQRCGNKGFLLISEADGLIDSGSVINFVLVDGVVKFEVSVANASKCGITISSKLLSNASAIKK